MCPNVDTKTPTEIQTVNSVGSLTLSKNKEKTHLDTSDGVLAGALKTENAAENIHNESSIMPPIDNMLSEEIILDVDFSGEVSGIGIVLVKKLY